MAQTKTQTATPAELLRKQQDHAKSVANNAPQTFEDFAVGTVTHQGDLILLAINKPKQLKVRKNLQLAEGNTQGSRHVLVAGSKCYDGDVAELQQLIKAATGADVEAQYIGPVFELNTTLEHPEHGAKTWQCDGWAVVVFQRNQDALERAARVQD